MQSAKHSWRFHYVLPQLYHPHRQRPWTSPDPWDREFGQIVAQMHVIDRLEAIEGKGRACAITQQDQSSQARRSSRLTVLVDAVEADRIVACSYADAPEIDGQVLIPGAWEIEPGDFIKVTVTGSGDYDLRAEPVEDWRRLPRSRAVHPAKAGRVV